MKLTRVMSFTSMSLGVRNLSPFGRFNMYSSTLARQHMHTSLVEFMESHGQDTPEA